MELEPSFKIANIEYLQGFCGVHQSEKQPETLSE